jgi:hypothetical protein
MTKSARKPPRLPDGTVVHVRSEHFVEECDGVISGAFYSYGWLYRIEVTAGDRLDAHRHDDGELWICDFEVQRPAENG